jgi:ABC-2 type transport system permease protein
MSAQLHVLEPTTTRIGRVNWIGFRTLYVKEVLRFFKVLPQTVLAPMMTTLLFLVVFKVAIAANRPPTPGGIAYAYFLAPGLIMMAITQNAFMNTSSSLMVSKVQGNVVDILMPPLSAAELTCAYLLGGVTRAIVVALSIIAGMLLMPFPTIMISHPWAILYFALAGSALLAALGVMAAIWAEKFDHVAMVTNFVVTPLSFLSGTFYSVDRLGHFWGQVSHANPFFFIISGFRYGFTGQAVDLNVGQGAVVLLILDILAFAICHKIFKSGYRLKS